MALSRYADISTLLNDIWEGAIEVARHSTPMAGLVYIPPAASGLAPRKNSIYTGVTITTVGEDDDVASQAFNRALLSTLTPAEAAGQIVLTDSRIESDDTDVRADASRELGGAVSEKIDTDLAGNFSSLTGGTIGAAGTTITWGYVMAARSKLRNTKGCMPPYYCVLHEYQWHQLAKATSIAATTVRSDAPMLVDEVMRRWYVGQLFGDTFFFTDNNISINASDDAYGAIFNREAIALDVRRPLRIEPERDASRRAWELTASTVYAHGVWRPTFGVQLLFDATTPTS